MAKRCFDVVIAMVAVVLFAPLMIAIAIWVKLDSPGPVLFRQQRVGRHGALFFIHKFRTMVADAGTSGPQITAGDDARITRAGRVLRRHKLDELPQLFDVLRGAMSLVGPRPEVPRYVAMYPEAMRSKLLSVRPGLTDPVSLQFFDESAVLGAAADPEREYVEVLMPRKLAAAVAYAEQATLATDVRTIAQTLRMLIRRWTTP